MKFIVFIFLLLPCITAAQQWQAEIIAGAAGYNGDLTQHRIALKELRPAAGFNVKYKLGQFVLIRAGIIYAKLGASDKNNTGIFLKNRNLNFETNLLELNLIAELNLFEPGIYTSYPYLLAGIGVFHFNPYTYYNGKKVYLQPLSTEGEGLKEYAGRKNYSLNQVCIPVGGGWKSFINDTWEISFEFGVRILFTDYLDDVSKTYADPVILTNEKGPEAVALSYRGNAPFQYTGERRGNSSINDIFFFSGIKFTANLYYLFKKREGK